MKFFPVNGLDEQLNTMYHTIDYVITLKFEGHGY